MVRILLGRDRAPLDASSERLSARVSNYEGIKINTNCFDGTHSTRSDSSEAAAACQGSACFVQELSLISVMIFVDATCSPGNDKNVALVV